MGIRGGAGEGAAEVQAVSTPHHIKSNSPASASVQKHQTLLRKWHETLPAEAHPREHISFGLMGFRVLQVCLFERQDVME